ncbi:MAG: zinc-ribbon and DUF3426 domain-containing protein [Burkholderiaceae bacterium]
MTLSTRCPACRTRFVVTPQQLALSQGWVRCGTCAEIFDASAHLQDAGDWLADAPAIAPPAGSGSPTSSAGQIIMPAPAAAESLVSASRIFKAGTAAAPPRDFAQDNVFGAPPQPAPESEAETEEKALQKLGFVRQAQRQAFWRKPGVIALSLLLCLMLVGVLGLQVAVHERDRIAALDPRTRPWLVQLCGHLNCTLAPYRQIESLVIDSSSFNKAPGDVYRFNLSIKNTSALDLAMPAVELVLTDTQDQPQVRRVLLPAELGAPEQLAASSEWSASLPVAVKGDVRVAGYRALVFYP